MPRWLSFGVGAPASDPSPRKRVPSSVLDLLRVSWMGQDQGGWISEDIQLRRLSDGKGSHANWRVPGLATAWCWSGSACGASSLVPATVMDEALGSIAMSESRGFNRACAYGLLGLSSRRCGGGRVESRGSDSGKKGQTSKSTNGQSGCRAPRRGDYTGRLVKEGKNKVTVVDESRQRRSAVVRQQTQDSQNKAGDDVGRDFLAATGCVPSAVVGNARRGLVDWWLGCFGRACVASPQRPLPRGPLAVLKFGERPDSAYAVCFGGASWQGVPPVRQSPPLNGTTTDSLLQQHAIHPQDESHPKRQDFRDVLVPTPCVI